MKTKEVGREVLCMELTRPFNYFQPTKIVFEIGAVRKKLTAELKLINAASVLVVTDKGVINAGLLKDAEEALKEDGIQYTIFDEIVPNPRTESCHKGSDLAKSAGAKAIIGVGGGSPMDVAKAIAILVNNDRMITEYEGIEKFQNDPLPILSIPTTAGTGSEVTSMAIITVLEKHYKMSIVSNRLFPRVALLDPTVLTTMPAHIAAACGLDALTHAIEAYTSRVATPPADGLAIEAIRLIGKYLRRYVANRANLEAASGMLVSSTLAGLAFNNAHVGNVHAMAHPLGGYFDVPHGVANAILLPYVMKYNMLADNGKYRRIAALLGKEVAGMTDLEAAFLSIEAIKKLSDDVGIPRSLGVVGVKEDKIPDMAKDAFESVLNQVFAPRMATMKEFEELYRSAL